MTPEERTQRMVAQAQQRFAALDQANEVRFHRAALKRKLATGEATFGTVLRSGDPLLDTMLVRDLLRAAPGFGHTKVARALKAQRPAPLSPSMTVGRLTPQRREALLAWLSTNHPARKGQFA